MHEVVRRALAAALGEGPAPELQLRGDAIVSPQPTTMSFPGLLGGIFPNRWIPAGGGRGAEGGSEPAMRLTPPADIAPGAQVPAVAGLRPMIPLGQFRDTFIIAIDDEAVSIIDQHVAHERVLFERVMQRLTDGRLESQLLLEPLIVELSASGCEVLLGRASELERFGFEVAGFGGNSVRRGGGARAAVTR